MGVKYEIDAGGNFVEQMAKNVKATEPLSKGFVDAAKAAKELERDAKKALESIQTPLDKHNKSIERMKEIRAAGLLTEKEFLDVQKKLNKEYDKSQMVTAELVKQNSFMDKGAELIKSQVMGWAGVTAGIAAATKAFSEYDSLRSAAQDRTASTRVAAGRLQQIARDDKELAGFISSGKKFAQTAGLAGDAGLTEGYDTVNQLANIGEMKHLGLFAKMRRNEMVGPIAELLPGIKAIKDNAPNSGDIRNVLAVALGASGSSSKNLEPILQYMPKVAIAGKSVGLSFEQIAAVMSAQATAAGNAEVGAGQAEGFLGEMRKKGAYQPGMTYDQLLEAGKTVQFEEQAYRGYQAAISPEGRLNYQKALADIQRLKAPGVMENMSGGLERVAPEMAAIARKNEAEQSYANALNGYGIGKTEQQIGAFRAQERAARFGAVESVGASLTASATSMIPLSESQSEGVVGLGSAALPTGINTAIGPVGQIVKAIAGGFSQAMRSQPKAPPLATGNP